MIRPRLTRPTLSVWLPLALAAAGIALTLFVWRAETDHRRAELAEQFTLAAEDRAHSIERELRANLTVVAMLGGLVAPDGSLDEAAFFGAGHAALEARAPVQALEWIPRVAHADRAAFEARTGYEIRERNADGDLVRAAERPYYYPITLLNPMDGNELAAGFDVGSSPTRLQSLELARDTGTLQITEPIHLVQDQTDQWGFLAVNPVFGTAAAPGELGELLGFTVGAVRANDLIAGALSVFDPDEANVHLLDRRASAETQRFASHPAPLEVGGAGEAPAPGSTLREDYDVALGGASWTIVLEATDAFGSVPALDLWGLLVGGVLVSALTAVLLRVILVRAEHTRSEVIRRTSELRVERDRYQSLFDNAEVGIFTTGPDNLIRAVNPGGLRLLDRSYEDVRSKTPVDLVAPSHREQMLKRRHERDAGKPVPVKVQAPLLVGSSDVRWFSIHMQPLFGSDGAFQGAQGIFSDISDEVSERAELERNATSDSLTGLANRGRFDEFLEEQLAIATRYRIPFSLVMLDLDHFKRLNDDHGHQAGDEALKAVAEVLNWVARDADLVARYGGEEFALVLPHTDADGAARAGERCRAAIEAISCEWDGQTLRFTASVGVATYDAGEHGSTGDLVRDADGATYAAKQAGRNTVRIANDLAPRLQPAV